jgi:hypothetical protein
VSAREAAAAAGERLHERERLLELSDLTLAAYLRYLAAYGGVVVEEDGLLLFAGPHRQPNPYRNGALRVAPGLSAGEAITRAQRFFAARRGAFAFWVRGHGDEDLERAARDASLHELDRLPQLAMTEMPEYLPPPQGIELRRAADAQTREDYLGLVANAWGMAELPRAVAAQVFFDPDSLAEPTVAAYVAYYEGRPVSAAMTHVSHGVALACQGATIRRPAPGQRLPLPGPPGQSRGLAASCLCAALERSTRELGARLSLGQTSRLGAPTWIDLGYREISSYARYLVPLRVLRR